MFLLLLENSVQHSPSDPAVFHQKWTPNWGQGHLCLWLSSAQRHLCEDPKCKELAPSCHTNPCFSLILIQCVKTLRWFPETFQFPIQPDSRDTRPSFMHNHLSDVIFDLAKKEKKKKIVIALGSSSPSPTSASSKCSLNFPSLPPAFPLK